MTNQILADINDKAKIEMSQYHVKPQALSRYTLARSFRYQWCYLEAQRDNCMSSFDFDYNGFMEKAARFVRNY